MNPMLYIPFWNKCSKCRILQKKEREREISKLQLHSKSFLQNFRVITFHDKMRAFVWYVAPHTRSQGSLPLVPQSKREDESKRTLGRAWLYKSFGCRMYLFKVLSNIHRNKIHEAVLCCAVRLMGALWCCWLYCVKWVWRLVLSLNVAF